MDLFLLWQITESHQCQLQHDESLQFLQQADCLMVGGSCMCGQATWVVCVTCQLTFEHVWSPCRQGVWPVPHSCKKEWELRATRGYVMACIGHSHSSRSHMQLSSCLTSLLTCQLVISCHPLQSQDKGPKDQRFLKKKDEALRPPPPRKPNIELCSLFPRHASAAPLQISSLLNTGEDWADPGDELLCCYTSEQWRQSHWSGLMPATCRLIPGGRSSQVPGSSLNKQLVHPADIPSPSFT